MFASLFRKQKSARTIRYGSPRRARLGVENLEDRTVPSTLLGNLGPDGDGAYLLGGVSGGVLGDRTEQVSVSANVIQPATIGDEIPSLLGGVSGGVLGDRSEQVSVSANVIQPATIGDEIPSLLGGVSGGVLGDRSEQVSVSANVIQPATIGDEIPSLLGGVSGGVLGDRSEQVSVSANSFSLATIATPKLFGELPDAGGADGSYELLITRSSGEEIPQ